MRPPSTFHTLPAVEVVQCQRGDQNGHIHGGVRALRLHFQSQRFQAPNQFVDERLQQVRIEPGPIVDIAYDPNTRRHSPVW